MSQTLEWNASQAGGRPVHLLQELLDSLIYTIRETHAVYQINFADKKLWEWVFVFFPFFLFGEVPMYLFPAAAVFIDWLKRPAGGEQERKERFMATGPSVSVLIVGYNEEDSIANAIESLLEFKYPGLEIVVVDDGSTDRMYERALPYAERGLIKLFRNTSATGRAGRPVASNLALSLSSGEFILSVDADTSFDRNTLLHMIGPFYNPEVGVVAGNLKVRNVDASFWTRMQEIDYMQSISLRKRALNLVGRNLQASGAFGAFRRSALEEVLAWDPELAEDADLSLKLQRSGWKIEFAPEAIAMTNVPPTMRALFTQRYRWDRGLLRTYYHKHGNLMQFWRYDWGAAAIIALEYLFTVIFTYLYVAWLVFMLIFYPVMLLFVIPIAHIVYTASTYLTVGVPLLMSERRQAERNLLFWIPMFPVYKAIMRWVRLYALILETLRINYGAPYLPESAWRNTPRW